MLRKRVFSCAILAAAGLVLADTANAALTPTSGETNLSANAAGSQKRPAVAAGPDAFLAVWEDSRVGPNLRGRRIGTEGELLGEEIPIDAGNGSENVYPDVAAVGSGFVAVWRQDDLSDDDPPAIVGRMLDGNGLPTGDEFRIDTPRDLEIAVDQVAYLSAPRVAGNGEGFVVVWASGKEVLSQYSTQYYTKVFARHFTKLGEATADDEIVIPYADSHLEPDIGATESGFVATARFVYYSANDYGSIKAQRLDSAGARSGDAFHVSDGYDAGPTVVAHANGVDILWTTRQSTYATDAETPGLRGRRFDQSGEALSNEFALNSVVPRSDAGLGERDSAASPFGQDRFVAVWTSGDAVAGLWAQAFTPDGRHTSPLRQIDVTQGASVAHPDITILGDSAMAVVWEAGGSDVFVRTFDIVAARCGDADGNGATTSTDALLAIRAAVGIGPCAPCVCDADGSGGHTAADALAVLRAAVGVPATLACPICTEGSGTAFDLDVDRDCFGARVEIPRNALPADLNLLSCTVDPALRTRSCETSLEVGDDGVVFDLRGCSHHDTVFSCVMPAAATAGFAEHASVRCGCGCRECPTAPKLCARGPEGEPCSAAPASVSRPGPMPTKPAFEAAVVTSTVTESAQLSTTTSSSVSFCGTCCNLEELGQIEVASPAPLTELLVRVKSDYRGECVYCYRDLANYSGEVYTSNDGWDSGGDSVSICVIDHEGFDAQGVVAGCEGHGLFVGGAAEVVYARGLNFETIDPLPPVVVTPVPE